jgi:hypothetical protein
VANLTITVPEGLKAQMDAQAEVNWSEVCRNAISLYLENRRNVVPKLSLRVDRTAFSYNLWMRAPQLTTLLAIRNLMGREIILDRVLYGVNLSLARSGNMLAHHDGVYLNKHVLAQDSEINLALDWSPDYMTMERLIRTVKASMNLQSNFTIFVEGIKQAHNASGTSIIPIDEWNEAVQTYQKGMGPSSNI